MTSFQYSANVRYSTDTLRPSRILCPVRGGPNNISNYKVLAFIFEAEVIRMTSVSSLTLSRMSLYVCSFLKGMQLEGLANLLPLSRLKVFCANRVS